VDEFNAAIKTINQFLKPRSIKQTLCPPRDDKNWQPLLVRFIEFIRNPEVDLSLFSELYILIINGDIPVEVLDFLNKNKLSEMFF